MGEIRNISSNAKVREINQLIINSFKKYIPQANLQAGISILSYSDKGDYEKAYRKVSTEEINRTLGKFRQEHAGLYLQAEQNHGSALAGQLRGLSILQTYWRYQSANIASDGFYTSFSNTIHLLKDDALTIAHELLHKYSYARDKQGSYSYFEKIFNSETAEGIVESLSLEIAKAYARNHNLKNDLILYDSAEYPRLLLSKDYLKRNSFSQTSVLHLLFEGWFKEDAQKGFVPSDSITSSRDLKKFSDQEAKNFESACKWLAVSKMKTPASPLRVPGQAPIKSVMSGGLPSVRPRTGPGPVLSISQWMLQRKQQMEMQQRMQNIQRQVLEQQQKRIQQDARIRVQESLRRDSQQAIQRRIQEEARRRATDEARRRAEEETRRRAAEQKRAQDEAKRRALEEERRRAQEEARRRQAMDSVRVKRPEPKVSNQVKYMILPHKGPPPPPPGPGPQPPVPRPYRAIVQGGPVISLTFTATGKPYPGR